jgi:hypothetical protein
MLCEYGCGNEAKYQFKNGKWCCSSHRLKCPSQRKRQIGTNNPFYGKNHSTKTKNDISQKNKGKDPWNRGIPRTEEEKEKISEKTKEGMNRPEIKEKLNSKTILKGDKHPKWNGGYYNKGIPLFNTYSHQLCWVEEIRQDPKDKNILQTKCAYCGKWFRPTVAQIYERIRSLNGKNYGEQRIYCSDKCKQECPIFHQISYPKGFKSATSREVQPELRQLRFKKDNYTCQKCGKHQNELTEGLHCHHIEGVRWEPLESADIDKVITLCKSCHKKVHQTEGCSYYDLKCGK